MMKGEPKVGDIIKYEFNSNQTYYGLIERLPYGELVIINWFDNEAIEQVGIKISIWGYGNIWNIAS